MRGTHRGVWSSKGQRLIEAELFAAESKRSAQNGRALLCAANHASEIQGSSAAYKLKDARNRAPVIPRFAAHLRCVSAKEGKGSQEGTGNHTVSCPLLFPPVNTGNSPAVGTASPPPKAAIVHAHLERKVASSGAPLYRRKVYRLPTVKRQRAPLRFLQKIIHRALTTSDVRIIMYSNIAQSDERGK